MRYAIAALSFAAALPSARAADFVRCTLREDIQPKGGFTDPALRCEGELQQGISVKWTHDGRIEGINWREQQDARLCRVTRVLIDGGMHFGAIDENKGKKWSAQYRGIDAFAFPPNSPMWVEKAPGEDLFRVHDATGMVWLLEAGPNPKYSWNRSYRILRVGEADQPKKPVGFDEASIIGVDLNLTGARPFRLIHRRHSNRPYAKATAPAYARTKSHIFDRNGRRCAIANRELFELKEGDEYEGFFRFAEDPDGFRKVLAQWCSKLDRTPLDEWNIEEPKQKIDLQPPGAQKRPHPVSPKPRAPAPSPRARPSGPLPR